MNSYSLILEKPFYSNPEPDPDGGGKPEPDPDGLCGCLPDPNSLSLMFLLNMYSSPDSPDGGGGGRPLPDSPDCVYQQNFLIATWLNYRNYLSPNMRF